MATKAAPEVETVKMDDGRIAEFSGKRRMNKDSYFDDTNVSVRIDFRNGETRTFSAPHGQSDTQSPGAKFAMKAMAHGLEQKLGDETSGLDVLEDMVEAIDQLMIRLQNREWNAAREGGGSGMAGASVLARALVEVTGQSIGAVREYLMGLDAKTKMALRLDATVAPVIKRLDDERAARAAARGKGQATIDTGAVLAGLMKG